MSSSNPCSISEKVFIDINGARQGMFIKGDDITKPVLLYLHGGLPDYFLDQEYPSGLEKHFIVVWWEQRGSGLSYDKNAPLDSVNLEQLVADTVEVTNYLRRRFNQEKIFLMGHSGGTFLGIHTVFLHPHLYQAYIAIAQISNQLKSEKLAYDYMLSQFKQQGNTKMVRLLEASPVTLTHGAPQAYLSLRDRAMHQLGIGTMHQMKSIITGLFLPSLRFRQYTLAEKINLWRGKAKSGVSGLWHVILATDLNRHIKSVKIPIYFIHGRYDYTVSYPEAKKFFHNLKSPVKGFYTFQHSAHSPIFEEPEKMQQIIVTDIMAGKNLLADK